MVAIQVLVIVVGVLGLGFCALVNYAVWNAVAQMSSPLARLDVLSEQEYASAMQKLGPYEELAERHALEWRGAWRLMVPGAVGFSSVVVWQADGAGPKLAAYLMQDGRTATELMTDYAGDRALSTGQGAGIGVMPVPPEFIRQILPDCPLEALWAAHAEGDAFARSTLGLRAVRDPRPIEEQILGDMRRVTGWIKEHPLWQLRGAYWFLTRHSRIGRTVTQQGLRPEQFMAR